MRRLRPNSVALGPLLVRAAAVGVVVWLAARGFGRGSCPEHDAVAAASSCVDLVSSLAVRVGAAASLALLLMELIATGLLRTAAALEEERRALAEEVGAADGESR